MRNHATAALVAALAIALLPFTGLPGPTLEGQVVRGSPDRPAPQVLSVYRSSGWLGMQINHRMGPDEPAAGRWIVSGVIADGPAEKAGVEEGDELLRLDGAAPSNEVLERLGRELQPGQEVGVRVRRDGRTLDLTLTAQSRPPFIINRSDAGWAAPFPGDSVLLRMQFDSIWPGVLRADSLRFRMQAPFDAIWTQGDSLRFRYFERMPMDSVVIRSFGELRGLDSLAVRMPTGSGEWPAAPLAVFRADQRVVAGAELTTLNEGLATYFGVDRGLLVVQVLEDGLFDRAGLRAGDVIRRVNGEAIESIPDLRRAIDTGWRSPPVEIEILRERQTRTLRMNR